MSAAAETAPGAPTGTRTALLVVGMHRSGTSALTRLLNLAGVDLGPRVLDPVPGDNDTGYWEHADIAALHERLLAALGARWDDLFPLPDRWWRRPEVEPFRAELEALLARDFNASPLFGLKDPRLCRLLPLWRELLDRGDVRTCAVLIARPAGEVVASLMRRGATDPVACAWLWLEHSLAAVAGTAGLPRVFVTYAQLLADWRGTLARIGRELGITWPHGPEAIAGLVEAFLEPGRRHHRGESLAPDVRAATDGLPAEVEASLDAAARGDAGAVAILDAMRAALARVRPGLDAASREVRDLRARVAAAELASHQALEGRLSAEAVAARLSAEGDQLRAAVATAERQSVALDAALREVYASRGWRLLDRFRRLRDRLAGRA